MKKQFLILLTALGLLSACSSATPAPAVGEETAPTPLPPTEAPATIAPTATGDSPPAEPAAYDLSGSIQVADFGFTISYPVAWFAETVENQLTISETERQLDPPGTQPPIEGYSIDFFHDPLSILQSQGLPEEPTLQDLLAFVFGFFGAGAPTEVEEITLFDVPAIRARSSIAFEGEPEHPFEASLGIREDRFFVLVLHATGEGELDDFLPIWRQMLDAIQPVEISAESDEGPIETASAEWEMITSEGNAVCADGSPSAFWIRPGDIDKLFIRFQGPYHDTFCRDAENCDLDGANPWIDPAIHLSEQFNQPSLADSFADEPGRLSGILDNSNPDNPLKDYTAVYIPYCTGDLFMGDVTQTYTRSDGTTYDIHHHGYRNAQAVLDIVYENIPAPEQILISGCEAGAAGALLQAPFLIEQYPDAAVVQLGEGFAGIFPEPIDFDSAWGVRQNLPAALRDLPDPFTLADLTSAIAQQYPDASFAQFNYAEDSVQATIYSTGGLPGYSGLEIAYEEFSSELAASLETIHSEAPNFHSFTLHDTSEQQPCALESSLLYWLKGGDTYYIDWLTALLAGEEVPNVNASYAFEAR